MNNSAASARMWVSTCLIRADWKHHLVCVNALLGGLLLLTVTSMATGQEVKKDREQIGEVLGAPVYRDEVRAVKDDRLSDELSRLFAGPVWKKYLKKHEAEVKPTKEEIETATAYFDREYHEKRKPELQKELKKVEQQLADENLKKEERQELEITKQGLSALLERPPGRNFALFILNKWKLERHLYENFGGGRLVWQQAGTEAFDATRKFLESREKAGEFKITDPKLKAVFYEYWTTKNHGSFLFDDKERIRIEFLEPAWAPKPREKK